MSASGRHRGATALAAVLTAGVVAASGGGDGDARGVEATSPPPPVAEVGPSTAPPGTPTTSSTASPTSAIEGSWRQATDAPLALTEVAAAPFAGAVWTAGGLDAEGQAVAAVQVYDPTFDAWSEGPTLPQAVHHSELVSAGDRLYLLGGYAGAGFATPVAAVAVLDASTGRWQPAPPLPEPRAAGAAAWDGQRVVYGGGVGPGGVADEVWALQDGGWSRLGSLSQAREHLAAAGDGHGRVWFLAGRDGGLTSNLSAVDLAEGGQVSPAGSLPTARGGAGGFYAGPEIGACAAGGESADGTFAEVECLNADGRVTVLPELGVPRHGAGTAVLDGTALVLLGGPEPGLSTSGAVEALALPTGS